MYPALGGGVELPGPDGIRTHRPRHFMRHRGRRSDAPVEDDLRPIGAERTGSTTVRCRAGRGGSPWSRRPSRVKWSCSAAPPTGKRVCPDAGPRNPHRPSCRCGARGTPEGALRPAGRVHPSRDGGTPVRSAGGVGALGTERELPLRDPAARRGAGLAPQAAPVVERAGAPDRIRTCDLWLRRPTLYPTELRARHAKDHTRVLRR